MNINIATLDAGHYAPENGTVKLTTLVGESWRNREEVTVVRHGTRDDASDIVTLGVAPSEFGAHYSYQPGAVSAWWLIVKVPVEWLSKQQRCDILSMSPFDWGTTEFDALRDQLS